MDVTVYTREPVDLGHGPTTKVVFPSAQSVVDKQSGTLHVHDSAGTIGSFNAPVWQCSVRGTVRSSAGVTTVTRA